MNLRKIKLVTIISLLLIFYLVKSPEVSYSQGNEPHNFDFTLTDSQIENTSNYEGKPLIIEWGASWCPICEDNQEVMKEIYQLYNQNISILSLSYGGSGDDLDDVIDMKNRDAGYVWDFALDHSNYASQWGAANGDTWILDENLVVVASWDHVRIRSSDIVPVVNSLLTVVVETTVVSQTTIETEETTTIIQSDTTLISTITNTITKNNTLTKTETLAPNVTAGEELLLNDFTDNPLFVGTIVVLIVGTLGLIFTKYK